MRVVIENILQCRAWSPWLISVGLLMILCCWCVASCCYWFVSKSLVLIKLVFDTLSLLVPSYYCSMYIVFLFASSLQDFLFLIIAFFFMLRHFTFILAIKVIFVYVRLSILTFHPCMQSTFYILCVVEFRRFIPFHHWICGQSCSHFNVDHALFIIFASDIDFALDHFFHYCLVSCHVSLRSFY